MYVCACKYIHTHIFTYTHKERENYKDVINVYIQGIKDVDKN